MIEDSRKVLQDFLAPELRAIAARLDALENRYGSLDRKVEDVDRRAETRHGEVMSAIERLADYNSIRERVARLESKDTHQ